MDILVSEEDQFTNLNQPVTVSLLNQSYKEKDLLEAIYCSDIFDTPVTKIKAIKILKAENCSTINQNSQGVNVLLSFEGFDLDEQVFEQMDKNVGIVQITMADKKFKLLMICGQKEKNGPVMKQFKLRF